MEQAARPKLDLGPIVGVPLSEEMIRLLLHSISPPGGGYSGDRLVGVTQAALSIGLALAVETRAAGAAAGL
jgi:hypothetical protein